jgi:hypothetical protein
MSTGRYSEHRIGRILRNLKITEVSGVDRGAGRGVKILLTKNEGDTMPVAEIEKKASAIWSAGVRLVMKRDGVSENRAIDIALADPVLRQAYDLQKNLYLAKMGEGAGEWPGGPHQTPDPENPHATTAHHVGVHDDDREAQRLRDVHPTKALKALTDAADAIGQANPHLSQSECLDRAAREFPHLWQRAKQARGIHLPLAADENAGRARGAM